MNNSNEITCQAQKLSNYKDLDRLWPIEKHERQVENERVDGQDKAIYSHRLLLEGDHNAEKCEGLDSD